VIIIPVSTVLIRDSGERLTAMPVLHVERVLRSP
jgi:hypothetical protein